MPANKGVPHQAEKIASVKFGERLGKVQGKLQKFEKVLQFTFNLLFFSTVSSLSSIICNFSKI